MGSTFTTYSGMLKEYYTDQDNIEELIYPENALLTKLEKSIDTGFVGEYYHVPLILNNPQGVSGVFANAQTTAGLSTGGNVSTNEWQIQAGDLYGVVHIGDKVLMASRTNQGAYLKNKKVEIDGVITTMGDELSIQLWGNGGGSLGVIASIAGNVVTLTNPEQSANFENYMIVVASANDGSVSSHTLRSGSDQIEGINRSTGELTFDNVADINSLSVGDNLFRQGDFYGDQLVTILKGVQAFIGASDTLGTLWNISNTVRNTDPQRYGGCRIAANDVSGLTLDERIRKLFSQMTSRFKAQAPDSGWLHPEDFDTLVTLMEARGTRPMQDESTKFGFMKIDIMTSRGRVPIFADRHCPKGHFFALRLENWGLASMGPLIHPQMGEDGVGEILRRASSTDYEFRAISYPAVWCNAMKNNGRVQLY